MAPMFLLFDKSRILSEEPWHLTAHAIHRAPSAPIRLYGKPSSVSERLWERSAPITMADVAVR